MMTIENLRDVQNISDLVLLCFKNELKHFKGSSHERFPHGCCDIASTILIRILNKEGFAHFKLIRGTNSEYLHHVWIESDKHIIDLTSHQFSQFEEPFILIDKSIYPLSREPYYSVCEALDPYSSWTYLEILEKEFTEVFFKNYYLK